MARIKKKKSDIDLLKRKEQPLDKYVQNLTPAEIDILRKKALKAAITNIDSENTITKEAVLFILSGEKYAIESKFIKETLKLDNYTPLPATPSFLMGVFNLRGQVISIVNIKEFFGLTDNKISELNRVIVLQKNDLIFGILVDRIEGIINIDEKNLTEDITTLKDAKKKYFKGVRLDGVIMLDGIKILNDKKLIIEEF